MSKSKKHLHARTSFLYQAATYLTLHQAAVGASKPCLKFGHQTGQSEERPSPLALQLGSDLQQVSRKGQLRLSTDLKRSMCKSCNAILVPGRTATQLVENKSKNSQKPWADVLILECKLCGGKKNFPIGAKKQLKRSQRKATMKDNVSATGSGTTPQSDSAFLTGMERNSVMD